MRLFTAIWPDAPVNDDINARLADAALDDHWRPTAPEGRHVTLCFHGDADAEVLAGRLAVADLTVAAGLRLRCRGAGVFGTALWLGVEPDDPAALAALVTVAGAEPAEHVAHLTVARARSRSRGHAVPSTLSQAPGPWWAVAALHLVASPAPYRTVARVEVPDRDAGKLG